MIDFSSCHTLKKTYAGANGNKISVMYENEVWMIKFPGFAKINDNLHYTNGCVSEYLGCHIFNELGVPAQETLLGTYSSGGKERLVVACKDFTTSGEVIQDFASLKNQMIDSERNGYGTELSDILETLEEQKLYDSKELKEHFWNVFIIDALIGNWDRHNGNWGFLYDFKNDEIRLAPIFDCGSSLYPQADLKIMKEVLDKQQATNDRIYNRPVSVLQNQGKRINYFDFISSLENEDCNEALKRISSRIDINKLYDLVDKTPGLNEIQVMFYKHMLTERKEKIIDFSLKRLKEKEII